jgi:hypothetical protein
MSTAPSYDLGTWGCYTNGPNGTVMPGFQPDPPTIEELYGEYEIILAASRPIPRPPRRRRRRRRRNPFVNRRRQKRTTGIQWEMRQKVSGSLLITQHPLYLRTPSEISGWFHVKGIFADQEEEADGMPGTLGRGFGCGFNASGMRDSNSLRMCSLGSLCGFLYVVSERKAFPIVQEQQGGSGSNDTESATICHAEYIYNTRHYSFLCREMGLSCAVSTLITQYIGDDVVPKPCDYPPYLYAEPGDIWIDRTNKYLSGDIVRTFLLARRLTANQNHVQSRILSSMSSDDDKRKYLSVGAGGIMPLVKWMKLHPREEPPPALADLVFRPLFIFRPRLKQKSTNRRVGSSNDGASAGNEKGMVTRSRTRQNLEMTQRVLRPRRKKVCYRAS